MEKTLDELKTIDYFFYRGLCPLGEEVQHDVVMGLFQPKRQLIYNRADGAGIIELSNAPAGASFTVKAKYNVASWAGRRNREVANGSGGLPDRRVALSQATVNVSFPKRGEVNITVLYIPLYDYKKTVAVSAPLAVGTEA